MLPVAAVAAVSLFPKLRFKLDFVDESFLSSARWQWNIVTELPVSMEDCWSIQTDNGAYKYWFPEIVVREERGTFGTNDGFRIVDFGDRLVGLFLAGSLRIEEAVDIYEDVDSTRRRLSFYFSRTSRPNFLTFKRAREEYICEAVDGEANKSIFIWNIGFDPGFITRALFFVSKRRFDKIFAQKCPKRLLEAIEKGDLPRR